MDFLTKEEIEKFGFTYESDATKCKTRKLRTYVPKPEMMDKAWIAEVVSQIPYQFVHRVWETPNPYAGDPGWCCDPKVLVTGHTPNGK